MSFFLLLEVVGNGVPLFTRSGIFREEMSLGLFLEEGRFWWFFRVVKGDFFPFIVVRWWV